jgi:hypothetical protein
MKIVGKKQYPYGVGSPTDSLALGFDTEEAACKHKDVMNELLDSFPAGWNIEYWTTKPEPWVVFRNQEPN